MTIVAFHIRCSHAALTQSQKQHMKPFVNDYKIRLVEARARENDILQILQDISDVTLHKEQICYDTV